MRIGIITQPLLNNYGGLLQNYALQQVLIRMGHTPITIDQVRYNLTFAYHVESILRLCLHNLLRHDKFVISEYEYKRRNSIVSENCQYFIDKYISHTNRVWSREETKRLVSSLNLDAYVVGSDQVWRPRLRGRLMANFLDFVEDTETLRLAYAASFGLDKWKFSKRQTSKALSLIKKFNAVSVREASGVSLCRDYLDVNATHVLDPTMLLNADDYMRIVDEEKVKISPGNMFCYILDSTEEKRQLIEKHERTLGLRGFELMPRVQMTRYDKNMPSNALDYAPIASWLRAFYDSDYVICDSFHGVVFSIIFNKPFTVIGNVNRGNTRFDSLLGIFDLNQRFVNNYKESTSVVGNNIDWYKVNEELSKWRNLSVGFLKSNL